jgi:hypothetical protein
LATVFIGQKMNQDIQKMNQDFYACHLFEFLRKENPLVSFCTMHFTGGFNYRSSDKETKGELRRSTVCEAPHVPCWGPSIVYLLPVICN